MEPRREIERKVITALFCDVVGSTDMAERLDPEDVERLLSTYHGRARRVIEAHGGTVEKFIGDAVVGVFGVPAAHEDDPARAIRASLAIVHDQIEARLDLHVARRASPQSVRLARLPSRSAPRPSSPSSTRSSPQTRSRGGSAQPAAGNAVWQRMQ